MFSIQKTFEFCYGHRVYTQQLDEQYAQTTECKCRHLHGHQAKVEIHLLADDLNNQGMVTDFAHLNWLKKFIDRYFDHKMILCINDPLLDCLLPDDKSLIGLGLDFNGDHVHRDHAVLFEPKAMPDVYPHIQEMIEGITLIKTVPTSENLAKFFYDLVEHRFKEKEFGVGVVIFWETPKSCATYYGE